MHADLSQRGQHVSNAIRSQFPLAATSLSVRQSNDAPTTTTTATASDNGGITTAATFTFSDGGPVNRCARHQQRRSAHLRAAQLKVQLID